MGSSRLVVVPVWIDCETVVSGRKMCGANDSSTVTCAVAVNPASVAVTVCGPPGTEPALNTPPEEIVPPPLTDHAAD